MLSVLIGHFVEVKEGYCMRWMYWLPTDIRQTLRNRVDKTIGYELDKNRWGALAPGSLDKIKHSMLQILEH